MLRLLTTVLLCLAGLSTAVLSQTVYVDQGAVWTDDLRGKFYTQDQGSRLMPLAWMRALHLPDGRPFLYDGLQRYGYLPLEGRDETDLPVGFTTNGTGANRAVGMTCAACHVRQIEVGGTPYRIDGGPAIVDFQALLQDLDTATQAIATSDTAFADFAARVLGDGAQPSEAAKLKDDFEIWARRYHAIMAGSLPDPGWGPARLDAFAMIFNRLGGLDIGPKDTDGIIAANIARGDAPARYPFLWNAALQDYTQWPGFLLNGNELFGLVRNLGEAYGVFTDFRPTEATGGVLNRDYLAQNSVNWDGLQSLERWLLDMGPPKWPWALDEQLATDGKAIFDLPADQGGCVECHGVEKGAFRSVLRATYKTRVEPVGTDTAGCKAMNRTLQTGVLEGASIPVLQSALKAEEPAVSVLAIAVLGAIVQNSLSLVEDDVAADFKALVEGGGEAKPGGFLDRHKDLAIAFDADKAAALAREGGCKYEARVLEGVWAAAPYLHNGSVPTLAELLKKPADRVATFTPGPSYDTEAVGMAVDQTMFDYVYETTGCDDLTSGNSRCGHDYGTDLSDDHKRALIEYLKSI